MATPSIRASLGASGAEQQLVVAGYIFSYAMLLIVAARLGATYGCRRIYLIGLGIFGLTSLACGLAFDPVVLILARLVQGIGAALIVPQVLTTIRSSLEGADQARALGLYPVALSAGAVAGQVLGGLLISANLFDLGWRPIFLINVPISAVLILLTLRNLPADPEHVPGAFDLSGVGLLSAAIAMLIVPLMLGREAGWPPSGWLLLLGSAAAAGGFVVFERRRAASGRNPLLNLDILARLSTRWKRVAGIVGYSLLPACYLGVSAWLLTGHPSGLLLLGVLGAGGLGLGTGFGSLIAHLTAKVPKEHASDLSGLVATAFQIAASIGVASFGGLDRDKPVAEVIPHDTAHMRIVVRPRRGYGGEVDRLHRDRGRLVPRQHLLARCNNRGMARKTLARDRTIHYN